MNPKASVSSVNFQLSDEAKTEIGDLLTPLFKAAIPVCTVKLILEGDYSRRDAISYGARIVLELRSSEIVAVVKAEQLMLAVQRVLQEAQSQLVKRAAAKNTINAA